MHFLSCEILNTLNYFCYNASVYRHKICHKLLKNNIDKLIPFNVAINREVCVKYYCSKPSDNPVKRVWNLLKSDLKYTVNLLDGHINEANFRASREIFPVHCDICIVGGGIIGSSIAYWLQQRALSGLTIVVLEKDSLQINFNTDEYSQSSAILSAGGLQQQFSLSENIQMSMFGAEFLRNIDNYLGIEGFERPTVNFTPQGYLFLATEKSSHILEENSKLQQSLGAKVELLTTKKIKQRYPWMNINGVKLGCHGLENEGWFDPWSLLMAFKRKAMSLGTTYVSGELDSFKFENMPSIVMDNVPLGEYVGIRGANIKLSSGETKTIEFSQLIIAADFHSGAVGKLARMGSGPGFLQLPLPVSPRKRYVYYVHCANGPGWDSPFVVDPSGMYFRSGGFGDNFICGRCPDPNDEPKCDNLEVDYGFYNEQVWPVLAHRVPAFENLKVTSGWAGYYDFNSFDENAFIGPHPSYTNVFLATGFSGHDLQHAPAVGRAIMELIIDGQYMTIDLTRMQFERIFHDEYLLETNIV